MSFEWMIVDRASALRFFKLNKEVFLLFADNTESLVECELDISNHDGEYGIESSNLKGDTVSKKTDKENVFLDDAVKAINAVHKTEYEAKDLRNLDTLKKIAIQYGFREASNGVLCFSAGGQINIQFSLGFKDTILTPSKLLATILMALEVKIFNED